MDNLQLHAFTVVVLLLQILGIFLTICFLCCSRHLFTRRRVSNIFEIFPPDVSTVFVPVVFFSVS